MRRVEFLNDRFVAVGDQGVLLTSLDGRAWTRPTSRTVNHLHAVAYGAGRWVAVGSDGLTLSSSDAVNWRPATVAGQGTFRGVAYGNGFFVAVSDSGNVITSADGINWEGQGAPELGGFRDITFVGGRFLALAESPFGYPSATGRLLSSENGSAWVRLGEWSGVTYTGISKNLDRWVAVGRSGRIVAGPEGLDRVLAITGPQELLAVEGEPVSVPISIKGEADRFDARGLPPGLYIDSDSGRIAGWPSEAGEFDSFLLAYDERGPARPFYTRIKVLPEGGTAPTFDGPLVANASETGVISYTVEVSELDDTSVVTVGDLPEGLTFDDATRVLSGTLAAPGFYEIPVEVTNIYGTSEAVIRLSYPSTVAVESGSVGVSSNTVAVAYHDGRYVAATTAGHILSSTDGQDWTAHVSNSPGRYDVIFANGLWVVVGGWGQVYTSPNGTDWTLDSVGSQELQGIAYGNGVYVAVGNGIFTSQNGTTWTAYEGPLDGTLRGVAFGDGRFVAVGLYGTIMTSTDGESWTTEESGTTNLLGTVAYGQGVFVAGGTGTLLASDTPGQWREVGDGIISSYGGVSSLISTPNGFAGLSSGLLVSPDGVHWIRRNIGAGSFSGLAYGENQYVATGNSGRTSLIPDAWTPMIVGENRADAVAGEPFSFQVLATDGATNYIADGLPAGLVLDSVTGRIEGVPLTAGTFTVKIAAGNRHGFSAFSDLTLHLQPAQGNPPAFTGPDFAEGMVNLQFSFAVPLEGMDAATVFSAEGLPPGLTINPETGTISGRPEVFGVFDVEVTVSNYYGQSQLPVRIVIQGNPWHHKIASGLPWPYSASDVAFGNGRYVVVAESGATFNSADAKEWELVSSPTDADLRAIVYGAGRFVAVGASGAAIASEDGLSWTNGFSGVAGTLNAVTHDDTNFVAVGANGLITTSPNGLDWTPRDSPTSQDLLAVTFGDGMFVAVGRGGTILSSADGITWALRDSDTTQSFWSVAHGSGRFMTVGSERTVRSSEDGKEWIKPVSSGLGSSTGSIIYGRDEFLVVGPNWEVRTSRDGQHWTLRTPYSLQQDTVRYAGEYYFNLEYTGAIEVSDGHWPPELTVPSDAIARKGESFSLTLEAGGVHETFHALNLPTGLSLNEATGEISGIPEDVGQFEVVLYANGEWGPSATEVLNLTVEAPDLTPPALGATRSLLAEIDEPFARELTFTGNTFDAGISVEGLPEGLDFDPETRRIAGTPFSSGYFPLTVSIASPLGDSEAILHLKVVEEIDRISVQGVSNASAVVSYPFSFVPALPLQMEAPEAFGLPPGVSLDAATGNLSGVPTEAGMYYVMIAGTAPSGTLAFQLTIDVEYMAPQIISWPVSVVANPGETVEFRVSALGSELEYQWRKDSAPLNDDGRITGSRSGELRIDEVMPGDAGDHRVSVSNDRGFLAGEPVMLTVLEPFALWAERVLPEGTGEWWEDSFGSGVPNLLWYAIGAEGPDRTQLPQMVRNGTWVDFHFSRNRSAKGIQLRVEESRDLLDWGPASSPLERIGEEGHIERWRLRVPATDFPRFFRVRAVLDSAE